MRAHISLLLIAGCVAYAQPAYVNCAAADNGGIAGTSQATAATSLTAGSSVYVVANFLNNCGAVTMSITDTASNTYTQIGTAQSTVSAMCTMQFYAKNVTGNASNVYTVTASASVQSLALSALQMSAADTTSPLDQSSNSGVSGATTTVTSTAVTTTTANQLLLAGGGSYASGGTWTADTGWTMPAACTAPNKWSTIQYKQVTATQTGMTTVLTKSASTFLSAVVATFKEAIVVQPFVPKRRVVN